MTEREAWDHLVVKCMALRGSLVTEAQADALQEAALTYARACDWVPPTDADAMRRAVDRTAELKAQIMSLEARREIHERSLAAISSCCKHGSNDLVERLREICRLAERAL